MAIKTIKVAADFETTTDPNDVRVWAACAVDINTLETVHISNSIDSFFEWAKDKHVTAYFHNLKFDGEFIISYLLRNGFTYSESREPRTFSTLITDMGLFYSITVIFEKKNKKYKKITFYDSLKKLPFKVATIARAFELEDKKLSIDYDAPRPIGHELTDEEKEYIVADCRIVAAALKIQFEKGLKRMTNASDAIGYYKELMTPRQFDYYFPKLPLEIDDDIRRAYKGGYVYLKPEYKNRYGLQGITLDVNSLYPWAMRYNVLPWGYPLYFEGEPVENDAYPLYIVRIECAFDLKPNHLPTIQLKHSRAFMPTEYLTTSDGEIVEMTLTNVDLELMKDHYIISDLKYINGWRFKGRQGLFDEYIDHWVQVKKDNEGAVRQLAKLMLNSLYGKFAKNPRTQKKAPTIDRDEIVHYILEDVEIGDPVYTAMAAFITAYAKNKTIRSGQKVYDRFIYCDTDSLHLIGYDIPDDLDVHPKNLGAWKHEGNFVKSKYLRAKTYMETMCKEKPDTLKNYASLMGKCDDLITDGVTITYYVTTVTCAGMPDNVKSHVNYHNFHTGSTFDGKLLPRRYKGGVVLESTTFSIK